jgi:hypothetical protein
MNACKANNAWRGGSVVRRMCHGDAVPWLGVRPKYQVTSACQVIDSHTQTLFNAECTSLHYKMIWSPRHVTLKENFRRVVINPISYSVVPWFEFRPENRFEVVS